MTSETSKKVFNGMVDSNSNYKSKINEIGLISELYKRINSAENRNNRDELIKVFNYQLIASQKNGTLKCSHGRCQRLLDTLTLIDARPDKFTQLSTANIMENLRNTFIHHTEKLGNIDENDKMSKLDRAKLINSEFMKIRPAIESEYKDYLHLGNINKLYKESFNFLTSVKDDLIEV